MSLSSSLNSVVHWASCATGLSTRLARGQAVARILSYRSVGSDVVSSEALAAGLEYVKAHFTVVPLATIVEQLKTGKKPDGSEVALVFDDANRGVFADAYPVLQRLGLPATLFVTPKRIELGQWAWPNEALARLGFLDRINRYALACTLGWRNSKPEAFVDWMLGLPDPRRLFVLEKLRGFTPDFSPTDEVKAKNAPMSWKELMALDSKLISIGSHSLTYPMLPSVGAEQLRAELQESRQLLELHLKRPVDSFCYPAGKYNDDVVSAVRKVYSSGVTSDCGVIVGKDESYRLPTIPAAVPLPRLAWRLHRPKA